MDARVERHVSATLLAQMGPALGALRAWRILRMVWLSGALDSGVVLTWGKQPILPELIPRRMLDEPDCRESMERTWPELIAAWKVRHGV